MKQLLLLTCTAIVSIGLSSCNSCSRNEHAEDSGTEALADTTAAAPSADEPANQPRDTSGYVSDRSATPEDLPVPMVYFAGGSRNDTIITLRELQTAGGIRVGLANNSGRPFTISKWSFNAFYNGELVGHVATNPHLTDDMRILIAEQGPGDVVIIDDVVAHDEQGRLYHVADLQLRIR